VQRTTKVRCTCCPPPPVSALRRAKISRTSPAPGAINPPTVQFADAVIRSPRFPPQHRPAIAQIPAPRPPLPTQTKSRRSPLTPHGPLTFQRPYPLRPIPSPSNRGSAIRGCPFSHSPHNPQTCKRSNLPTPLPSNSRNSWPKM